MPRTPLILLAAAIVVLVVVTTWPFRSARLVSWDAANFAFAIEKIDIAAHRPHPPGYLGYVFAGRALMPLFHEANAALTAWNVMVRCGAGILLAYLAWGATGGSIRAAVAAALMLCTSPLLWFYASNAEIYPSEMAWALAVASMAHLSLAGSRRALYAVAILLPITVLFKISAAVLLAPLALYVWLHARPETRYRSALVFGGLLAMAVSVFYVIQPNFLALLWGQFNDATAPSRVGGLTASLGRTLNRNLRDTAVNLLAAVGIVNGAASLVWLLKDRRLPNRMSGRLIALWAFPWLALLIFVHIGNPGYVLPLLPVVCLIVAAFYARQRTAVYASLVVLQALVNIGHIAALAPPPPETDTVTYREKGLMQRMASDLMPLSFPTLATIRQSDAAIDRLLSVTAPCAANPWVVATGGQPVDWRRVSYYLPEATAVRLSTAGFPDAIGHATTVTPVGPTKIAAASSCGLVWMSMAADSPNRPPGGHFEEGVGWIYAGGFGDISSAGLTWTADLPRSR